MRPVSKEKDTYLVASGYKFYLPSGVFVHPDHHKVFSTEFVDDNALSEIRSWVESPKTADWQFFFNTEPPKAVRDRLVAQFTRGRRDRSQNGE